MATISTLSILSKYSALGSYCQALRDNVTMSAAIIAEDPVQET
jgi:hypothetical protein